MSLDTWARSRSDRCSDCGYHVPTMGHGGHCAPTAPTSEWAVFKAALKQAARDDGTVHQCDVRPLIRGRIQPKHIGQVWKRARDERLLVEAGHERSDDREGRNAGRMEPYYRWAA